MKGYSVANRSIGRACVSAALRISYSVTFYKGDDRTYNISPVALLCVAEATIGILIYCVPSAPKALAGLKRGAQKSTAMITGQSKNSSSGTSAHAIHVKQHQREGYKEIDELPLTTLGSTRVTASGLSSDHENGFSHNGDGIMRTTTTTVSYRDDLMTQKPR
jgi:hypothetical protein